VTADQMRAEFERQGRYTAWACQHRAVNENTCWFCSDDRLGEGVPGADATAAALRLGLAPLAQRLRVHNGVIRIP